MREPNIMDKIILRQNSPYQSFCTKSETWGHMVSYSTKGKRCLQCKKKCDSEYNCSGIHLSVSSMRKKWGYKLSRRLIKQ